MNGGELIPGLVAAVLVFWGVGAHNRLVRLRNAIVAAFAPVDEQFRQRHGLLLDQIDALTAPAEPAAEADAAVDPVADADLDALLVPLRAACAQAAHACDHARSRPGAAGAVTSLRLAEEILAEARARLAPRVQADPASVALNAEIAAADGMLGFARRKFNDAVDEYNQAVRQFPTLLVAALFRFRPAGRL